MKRQNSIPQPLKEPTKDNQRRSSHEIQNSLNPPRINGAGILNSVSVRVSGIGVPNSNSVRIASMSNAGPRKLSLNPPVVTLEGNNVNFGKVSSSII